MRYFDEDEPLFSEHFIAEMCESEFFHNRPAYPFGRFFKSVSGRLGGFCHVDRRPLLLYPLNDMFRNNGAAKEQAAAHVKIL